MSRVGQAVVVGASTAGLSAARTLREQGWTGSIALVGDDPHPPYERPPLSKQILQGQLSSEALLREAHDSLAGLDVTLHLGAPAHSLDVSRQVLSVGDLEIAYDACLIAVGVRPRPLGIAGTSNRLHVLRSLGDALRLRAELSSGCRVIVVGAGFIGLEVAASARLAGCDVTVVEAQASPLRSLLGVALSAAVQRLHESRGVAFKCGVTVDAVSESGTLSGAQVTLSDGTHVRGDAVVVGIGAVPNTEWLAGAGVALGNGVLCDEFGRTSARHVFAAGDVSRWWHPVTSSHIRVEHWTTAREQGRIAALNMLTPWAAPLRSYNALPYFWSDQYDAKLQGVGHWSNTDLVHEVADAQTGKMLRLYGREDRVTGAVAMNWPGPFARWRRRITDGCPWAEAVADELLSGENVVKVSMR